MGNASHSVIKKLGTGFTGALGGGLTHGLTAGISAVSGKSAGHAISHFHEVMKKLSNID
jgi:predicted lipid-binding transport protein (Tim44 family)